MLFLIPFLSVGIAANACRPDSLVTGYGKDDRPDRKSERTGRKSERAESKPDRSERREDRPDRVERREARSEPRDRSDRRESRPDRSPSSEDRHTEAQRKRSDRKEVRSSHREDHESRREGRESKREDHESRREDRESRREDRPSRREARRELRENPVFPQPDGNLLPENDFEEDLSEDLPSIEDTVLSDAELDELHEKRKSRIGRGKGTRRVDRQIWKWDTRPGAVFGMGDYTESDLTRTFQGNGGPNILRIKDIQKGIIVDLGRTPEGYFKKLIIPSYWCFVDYGFDRSNELENVHIQKFLNDALMAMKGSFIVVDVNAISHDRMGDFVQASAVEVWSEKDIVALDHRIHFQNH